MQYKELLVIDCIILFILTYINNYGTLKDGITARIGSSATKPPSFGES